MPPIINTSWHLFCVHHSMQENKHLDMQHGSFFFFLVKARLTHPHCHHSWSPSNPQVLPIALHSILTLLIGPALHSAHTSYPAVANCLLFLPPVSKKLSRTPKEAARKSPLLRLFTNMQFSQCRWPTTYGLYHPQPTQGLLGKQWRNSEGHKFPECSLQKDRTCIQRRPLSRCCVCGGIGDGIYSVAFLVLQYMKVITWRNTDYVDF